MKTQQTTMRTMERTVAMIIRFCWLSRLARSQKHISKPNTQVVVDVRALEVRGDAKEVELGGRRNLVVGDDGQRIFGIGTNRYGLRG